MTNPHAAPIQAFIASAREPALVEEGELPLALLPGCYALDESGGRLVLEAWDESRHLVRAINGIRRSDPARLELEIRRFGNRKGSLWMVDRARAANHSLQRRAERQVFRERFRKMLLRNFPGWTVASISTEPDLHHSLPPPFARALLKQGKTGWAALGAPDDPYAASAAISYGLIWLDYLRKREKKLFVQGLALFLPEGHELAACLRLRYLNPRAAQFAVFLHGADNWEQQVDPTRHGNLDTALNPVAATGAPRVPPLPPEAELERLLRQNVSVIDGLLLPSPVYGQVPSTAGAERGIIDLLAVDHTGRLAVLELKASEDLHLPLQALDYWMRVQWHNQKGAFTAHGYFPGITLRPDPPRMLLIAPSLAFHPTTETILRYFSTDIAVERIGLAVEWQREISVVFRLRGAQAPH